jgi:DNA polymerase III subunit alpha
VELQRHPGEGGALTEAEAATERRLSTWPMPMDLPLVATNDVHFPRPDVRGA